MGLLESAVNGPMYHADATAYTYKNNPDQALLGINTPAEAYVANSLGGNYTPTTNMYGGPSEDVYAKAARENVDMTANRIADTAAPAVMASTGLGAPFAAALAAGNAAGQGYELQRMRQQMRDRGYQQMPYGSYAQGGIASAAQSVQNQGRNNDSMLVHMSPNEVKGLQNLAMATGGSLTINPHTGLPEAGWLDSILPMIGGIGLSMIPGVGPLAAAGIMGAGYTVATGSLEKGLMAGLGAYGGANIAGSLAEMGGSAIAEGGSKAAEETLKTATKDALLDPAGYEMPTDQLAAQKVLSDPNNFSKLTPEQLEGLRQAVPNAANPADIVKAAGASNATTGLTQAQSIGQGIKDVGTSGTAAMNFLGDNKMALTTAAVPALLDEFGQKGITAPTSTASSEDGNYLQRLSPNFKGQGPTRPNPYYQAQYPNYTYAAGGGLMSSQPPTPGLMDGGQPAKVDFMGGDMYPMSQQNNAHYATPSQMPTSAQQTMASYEPATNPLTGEATTHMASGGIASYAPGGYLSYTPSSYSSYNNIKPVDHLGVKGVYSDSDPDTAKKPADQAAMIRLNKIRAAANLAKTAAPKTSIKGLGDLPDVESAAGGGVMHGIGGYSDGGRMLKGPGDGMSDSIPATIGNKQPARLADGEFVVPADVVSHLGNGSTDAGAKRLYSMMDRIRKARTGKKKQAPAVKADKYLPA